MSLWDAANEIEELAYKLDSVRDAVELVAGGVDSPYSGALWTIYDMLDAIQNKMCIQAGKVMDLHRKENKPKKAKK
jgi:hypothetical protein